MKSKILSGLLVLTFSLIFIACSQDIVSTTESTSIVTTESTSVVTSETTIEVTTTTITTEGNQCNEGEDFIDGECVVNLNALTFSLEEVTADFDRTLYILDLYNPMLFSVQEDIDEVIAKQRLLLTEDMTTLEVLRVIAPVVAAYKCGHTHIFPGTDFYAYNEEIAILFPLFVRMFNQELYVVNNIETSEIPVGSKILTINGNSVEEILQLFIERISNDGDNVTSIYNTINEHFYYFFYLLIDSEKTFLLEYTEPESSDIHSLLLNGVTQEVLGEYYNYEEFRVCEAIYEENYAILKIRTFQPLADFSLSSFDEFFLGFFTYVRDNQIENVIIDLRGNGGGDPLPSSELFSYIAEYSQPYWDESAPDYYPGLKVSVPLKEPHFNGNLYVIINGGCFSTTGHFAALVESQDIAVFIGEETGGSYACSDSASGYNLPNTRLRLYTSKQIWQVNVEGLAHGRGIMPDYEVSVSLEDYLNGTDTVMEYTIGLISSSN